jgi:hypothetical protein
VQLLGRGRTAEVFCTEDNKALKLFYPDFGARHLDYEADKARIVGQHCSVAPAFYGSTKVDGRTGLLYECILGSSLTDAVLSGPLSLAEGARRMSRIHRQIHRAAGEGLPDMVAYFGPGIQRSAAISPAGRSRLMAFLRDNEQRYLCHGDLHPENLILDSEEKMWAIDWNNAYCGNPLSDIARTHYLLLNGLPPGEEQITPAELGIRTEFVTAYLDDYLGDSAQPPDWDLWRLVVLVNRYFEGIEEERPAIEIAVAQLIEENPLFA